MKSKSFDLKWTTKVKYVEKLTLPTSQLVNHFRDTDDIHNKSKLAKCLGRCPGCSALFFPRQHSLSHPSGLRAFLRDYIITQASVCLSCGLDDGGGDGSSEGEERTEASITAATVAAHVLRRARESDDSSPLLQCIHQGELLLGQGLQVPANQEVKLRPFVKHFLSTGGSEMGSTPSCSACASAAAAQASQPQDEAREPTLQELAQASLDGPANAWVVKNPRLSRGRGVHVLSALRKASVALPRERGGAASPRSTSSAPCSCRRRMALPRSICALGYSSWTGTH